MKNIKRKTKPDWNKLTAEDLQKLEIAEEIGVIDKIYAGGIHYTKSIEIIMKKWRIQNGSRKAVK